MQWQMNMDFTDASKLLQWFGTQISSQFVSDLICSVLDCESTPISWMWYDGATDLFIQISEKKAIRLRGSKKNIISIKSQVMGVYLANEAK